MNILNKKCNALAPTFGNAKASIPKREKFSWAQPCSPGDFKLIPKVDLNIDGSYQREEVSKEKVADIARDWDWKLFGTLSVVVRPDGSHWVYDGGHRCRASFLRDDITVLPCMVFRADDEKTEAKAFIGTNTMKSVVSAYHKHRASVKTGEPIALACQAIVEKYGYSVSQGNAKKFSFKAINTLQSLVKEDSALAEKSFGLCASICSGGEVISGEVLEGIFRCQKKAWGKLDVFDAQNSEKLRRESQAGIEIAIRREKHIMGKGGSAVNAKAILDILNKGKHRKVFFD